jgi:hypothetical protein
MAGGFGHMQGAFGRGFAGGGWRNHYGYGWGWSGGGLFWPYYYDAALLYALWPNGYYDPFFDYGPDDLFAGLFWPGYGYGYDYDAYAGDFYGGSLYARAPERGHRRHHREAVETQANAADICAASAPGVTDLPIERIEKAIQPSADQTNLLNDLKTATGKANDILRAACPSQLPLTPVSRVTAIAKRLDATAQAVDTIRAPLAKLYDSLGDEQKQKFDAIALGHHRRAPKKTEPGDFVAQCKERAQQFTDLPVQQISDTLKPTGDQKSAFDALKMTSDKAAANVEDSCPAQAPQNVTARFDAIDTRLKAMKDAINLIAPKLKDFYATLTDDQKAQFNLMTAPSPQAQNRG